MKILGVIPVRFASTRLPGKPLRKIGNKILIQHVWENISKSDLLDKLVIATDSAKVYDAVINFGGECFMTSSECRTGTERAAEVCSKVEGDIIVNIQGDEVLLTATTVDKLIDFMITNQQAPMGTIITPLTSHNEYSNPNVVKVVCSNNGKALYFSRAGIPFTQSEDKSGFFKHVGIYAYRRDILLKLKALAPTPLEMVENLEQLRALENNIGIHTILLEEVKNLISVNTEADLIQVEMMIKMEKKG